MRVRPSLLAMVLFVGLAAPTAAVAQETPKAQPDDPVASLKAHLAEYSLDAASFGTSWTVTGSVNGAKATITVDGSRKATKG